MGFDLIWMVCTPSLEGSSKPKDKSMLDKVKSLWGSGQSRGFRVAAWGAAIATFAAFSYYQNRGITDLEAHNKAIMAKHPVKN